uniref:Uncharacterized protein n=1 Tax=Arundo donax TaxID=35708 RepID=A0A0A8YJS2_ARUDO
MHHRVCAIATETGEAATMRGSSFLSPAACDFLPSVFSDLLILPC